MRSSLIVNKSFCLDANDEDIDFIGLLIPMLLELLLEFEFDVKFGFVIVFNPREEGPHSVFFLCLT